MSLRCVSIAAGFVTSVLFLLPPKVLAQGSACPSTGSTAACGIQFRDAALGFKEGDQHAEAILQLANPSARGFVVTIVADEGTATAGDDYTFHNTEVRFAPGDLTKSIPLDIRADLQYGEDNEYLTLRIAAVRPESGSGQFTTGPNLTSRVTIRNAGPKVSNISVLNDDQTWFTERPLGDSIGIQFSIPITASCKKTSAVFRPFISGSIFPDTVSARDSTTSGTLRTCVARASWTLSKTVGLQAAEIRIGNLRHVVEAFARHPARVIIGLALIPERGRLGFKSGRVTGSETTTATDAGGNTIATTRETRSASDTTTIGRALRTDAWAGVSFPLVVGVRGLRLFAGASVLEPAKRFYLGFQILQIPWPGLMESNAIDIGAGLRLNRQQIGEAGANCTGGGVCEGVNNVFEPFFTVTIDAGTALGALATLFQ